MSRLTQLNRRSLWHVGRGMSSERRIGDGTERLKDLHCPTLSEIAFDTSIEIIGNLNSFPISLSPICYDYGMPRDLSGFVFLLSFTYEYCWSPSLTACFLDRQQHQYTRKSSRLRYSTEGNDDAWCGEALLRPSTGYCSPRFIILCYASWQRGWQPISKTSATIV